MFSVYCYCVGENWVKVFCNLYTFAILIATAGTRGSYFLSFTEAENDEYSMLFIKLHVK